MALINCPECDKRISDKAEKCPGCGISIGKGQPTVSAPPSVDSSQELKQEAVLLGAEIVCPKCATKNDLYSDFCKDCGLQYQLSKQAKQARFNIRLFKGWFFLVIGLFAIAFMFFFAAVMRNM